MEYGTAPRGPELEEMTKGNVVLGITGALVGAVVGAIPWFLASTFTQFFIGWLGFVIGWASAFGYSKLNGRKSYGFAMATVVICSIIALVLADFASNMYQFCSDPEWQAFARQAGVPVAEIAMVLLTSSGNLHLILPNLIVGLLIGLLGVASCGRYVRQYTNPEMVQQQPQYGSAPHTWTNQGWARPASTGLKLPRQFTVRAPKRNLVIGIVFLVLAVFFLMFSFFMGILEGMGEGVIIFVFIDIWLLIPAVILILQGKNWRLEVDGDRLCAYTFTGKAHEFSASDIANISMPSVWNGQAKLYGRDGKVLFKCTQVMQNVPLLMQYLAEHNTPLRG